MTALWLWKITILYYTQRTTRKTQFFFFFFLLDDNEFFCRKSFRKYLIAEITLSEHFGSILEILEGTSRTSIRICFHFYFDRQSYSMSRLNN